MLYFYTLSMKRAPVSIVLATLCLAFPALAATDLQQQTKEAQVLILKYRTVEADKRAELEEKLSALLQQRAADIEASLEKDSGTFLHMALPSSITKALPDSLDKWVEHEIRLEGTVDQSIEFANGSRVQLRNRLGHRLTLWCVGQGPALVKGSTVSAEGYQLEDNVVASCGSQSSVQSLTRSGRVAIPLSVAFAQPKQGDVIRQTVAVAAGLPNNHSIAAVSLYRDGTLLGRRDSPPYTWSWDTLKEADGPHQLSLRANDYDLNVGNTTLTITVDNTPPRISLATPVERQNVSGTIDCEARATDVLGIDTVKFLLDGAAISVIVQLPYAMRWNTATVANGMHTLEAIATDRAGNQTISPAVSVRALNGNSAPLLIPIGSKAVFEGISVSFTVDARDSDSHGSPLTYKVSNLPAWANFDQTTHQFFGTPNFSVASFSQPKVDYPGIIFEVCDTQPLCVREAITITVKNVNRPPVMNPIKSRELSEGGSVAITPLITEPDKDRVDCTVISLPKWLTFDPKTCAISGTVPLDVASQKNMKRIFKDIIVRACDPEDACAEAYFSITVKDLERRSHLEPIGDKTVDEGRLLRFSVKASDPDKDPVSLVALGLPVGAVFKDERNGSGTFNWTPLENQAGDYTVSLEASDRKESESETLTITVRETSLSIAGIVQNSAGTPFAGLRIEAANANTFTRSTETDEQGFFIFKNLTAGSYRVRPVFGTGLNLPGNEGYDFEPIYRQIKLTDQDQNFINFTAIPKQ